MAVRMLSKYLAGDCSEKPLHTPCGTIHFTAPEVLQSYDYTTAADMWSLGMIYGTLSGRDCLQTANNNNNKGVIIYLLICGFPPFFDNQGNEQKLFQIIKKGKFSFPKLYFDDTHPSLKELISDLLKKRPIERYLAFILCQGDMIHSEVFCCFRLTCEEVRKCEWLTGIKQPKKKIHNFINPFLDNNDDANKTETAVNNPFLNNNNSSEPQQQKWIPPYMRTQSQHAQPKKQEPKQNVPPYMQFQQQQNAPPPPGPPVHPGTNDPHMQRANFPGPPKQKSNGYGQQYNYKQRNVPGPPGPPGTNQSIPGPPKIVMDL